ncbi:MAG: hypothetical protein U0802_21200 [Candidatus Binatia bacterium]
MRFRHHMQRLAPFHPQDPDLLSMLAFACASCAATSMVRRRRPSRRWRSPRARRGRITRCPHVWLRRGRSNPPSRA